MPSALCHCSGFQSCRTCERFARTPAHPLTPQQKQVFDGLQWLWSNRAEDRGRGRTHVLALAYIWRALQTQRPRAWVEVEDHHDEMHSDMILLRKIESMLGDTGCRFDVRPPRHFRIFELSPRMRDILDECELPLAAFQEPVRTVAANVKPAATVWDRLKSDD